MPYYPVFLDLTGKKCLVVGGGAVAERKIKSLLEYGARVQVVSPTLTGALQELVKQGRVNHRAGRYRASDLNGVFLAVSATDDDLTNQAVSKDCAARNIMVNVVDKPDRCSFIVPSVVHRGPLQIAVSTSGKSPHLARIIREKLESQFGNHFAEFVSFLGEMREQVKKNEADAGKRKSVLNNLVDEKTFQLLQQGDIEKAKERVKRACTGSGG